MLCAAYFDGVQALAALLYLKLYAVILADFVDQTGNVNEDVFASSLVFDETKTFGLIEEFYGSRCHDALGMNVKNSN